MPNIPLFIMNEEIVRKLEASRQELLDLTFRNPLLNYRPLRARGVEVIDSLPGDIFQALVRDGKLLPFHSTSDQKNALENEEVTEFIPSISLDMDALIDQWEGGGTLATESPIQAPISTETKPNKAGGKHRLGLQTASTPTDLFKRLFATETTARSVIEEQGVNTLFLALGMLCWFESDSSEQERKSPLILVPVTLSRSSVREQYRLGYTGEDIGGNLSLATLLQREFKLELPHLPDPEDLNVAHYLEEVELIVSSRKRWYVAHDRVALGFFSFSKYLMFKDLEENQATGWKPASHPTICSLLGSGFQEMEPNFTDTDHLDEKLPPEATRTITEADGTQILAIEDVKQGRNLIIQGPPGTGKSQTITNIIAEAIGQGKTVLFVAEKLAALEVVKSRLDKLGIGDTALELHSQKANKKSVLAELQRTIKLPAPYQSDPTTGQKLLQESQEKLNTYSTVINSPVNASEVTLHNAIGGWLQANKNLAGLEIARISIPSLPEWTPLEYQRRFQLVRELQAHLKRMGVPTQHPFWLSCRKSFLPTQSLDLRRTFNEALSTTQQLQKQASILSSGLHLATPETAASAEVLARATLRATEAPSFVGMQLTTHHWLARRAEIEELLKNGARVHFLKEQYGSVLIPEAWDSDVLIARQSIAAHGQKWYRFLIGDWRTARQRLAGLCTTGQPPKSSQEQLAILDAVLEYRRTRPEFERGATLGAQLFGAQWQGDRSQWEVLTTLTSWIIAVHEQVGGGVIPQAFLDFLQGSPDLKPLTDCATTIIRLLPEWQEGIRNSRSQLELDQKHLFGADGSERGVPLAECEAVLVRWEQEVERLQEMVIFLHLSEQMRESGITPLLAIAMSTPSVAEQLTDLFERTWFGGLIEAAIQAHPELGSFSGLQHEERISKFQKLDRQFLVHNRQQLAVQHYRALAPLQNPTAEAGQLRVLKREFEKRSRHLPIRQLIEKSGGAIQAMKPVFMMSPLSVATFLPPGSLKFDLVVFDEASQVKPVDALGALLRGSQAVVVGDSKQLPPTSFFDKLADTEAIDEENETADMESILGLFASQGAPQRMLRWHYRSRHESLIAVSNQEFYDNGLVIFPSPDQSREQLGLVYRYLPDTVYDRGGGSTNKGEARAVAEAAIHHARLQLSKPKAQRETLGIAAFSMEQASLIQLQLEMLRRNAPDCEEFFTGSFEPVFVKNLENVQGDERDVIFISVCYGRDKDGKIAMNFGPLNGVGGERRLNVLITRARLRCEVFTNMTPDDIDLNRTNARGVAAFKQFLAYARTGTLTIPLPTEREPDSPFERQVLAVISSLGYEAVPQVGCAGYFLDIGIKDPEKPGRFLLGIECDGATYHSARTARDRDRLREEVLRNIGWRIHRIWSTDWMYRYADSVRCLQEAIDAARSASEDIDDAEMASQYSPAEPAEENQGESEGHTSLVQVTTPEPIGIYQEATLPAFGRRDIDDLTSRQIAELIVEVVRVEGPVHTEEVARRIAKAISWDRVTDRVRAAVQRGTSVASQAGAIVIRDSFLWDKDMTAPSLRNRRTYTAKSIYRIAPEEIEAGVARVVSEAFGMPYDDIARCTGSLLGFERVTAEMREVIESIMKSMLDTKKLERIGESVQVPRSS